MARLIEITGKAIAGEWGTDDEIGNGIPVLRTTNFTNEGAINYTNVVTRTITKKNIEEKFLCPGDIIIEKSGGSDKYPVGRVVYFDGPEKTYLFNNFTGLLRVQDLDNWFPKYVFYSLFGNYRRGGTIQYENKTTGLHNLKTDDYVSMYEVTDADYSSQIKVCTRLDKVYSLIKMREQQLQLLDTLIKARFVEMTQSATTKSVRMGDVASYVNGFAFKPTDWTTEGLPIIRIQNLNDREASYNHYAGTIDSKYRVHEGDILVSWATHLEAYVWQGGDAWLNQHIFRVIFDKKPINKIYFVYSTEEALRQAFRNAHGFKPTMEHIKRGDFEDAIIELPPIEVQEQFSAFVSQVDKSKLLTLCTFDERILHCSGLP